MLISGDELVQGIRSARSGDDLHRFVQHAVELEHATILPYLCAFYSLQPELNKEIASTIRVVVVEEMLHMTIMGNLLTALGGTAKIAYPGFVPDFPTRLPLSVGSSVEVGLAPYSKELVENVFMVIESPKNPKKYPDKASAAVEQESDRTIGEVYGELKKKLDKLGNDAFVGDPARQVVDSSWFSPDRLFPLHSVDDATHAIDLIIEEGEGSLDNPYGPDGKELCHYYRFAELSKGQHLVSDGKDSYSYSGDEITFNPEGVWAMPSNPKLAHYRPGTRSRFMAEQFSEAYTRLLHALQRAFDGEPTRLSGAMGLMFELRLLAQSVLETEDEDADPHQPTGLCFEYRSP